MFSVDAGCCYRWRSMFYVCVPVSLSVLTDHEPYKTPDLLMSWFEMWVPVGQRNHILATGRGTFEGIQPMEFIDKHLKV